MTIFFITRVIDVIRDNTAVSNALSVGAASSERRSKVVMPLTRAVSYKEERKEERGEGKRIRPNAKITTPHIFRK